MFLGRSAVITKRINASQAIGSLAITAGWKPSCTVQHFVAIKYCDCFREQK